MPRAEMLHTKIKREILLSQSTAEAVEIAKQKIHEKRELRKPLALTIREHINVAIDKIDPLELAAILGTSYLIKTTIYADTSLVGKIKGLSKLPLSDLYGGSFAPFLESIDIILPKSLTTSTEPDIKEWIICFVIAFMIVRHGSELLNVFKSIGGIVGGFLGSSS